MLDQFAQHLEFDRLGDEVESTELEGADGGVDAGKSSDYRHRQARVSLLDVFDQLEAVAIRQAHVGETQPVTPAGEQCARFGDRAGTLGAEAHAQQGHFDQLTDVVFVINDEDIGHRSRPAPLRSIFRGKC